MKKCFLYATSCLLCISNHLSCMTPPPPPPGAPGVPGVPGGKPSLRKDVAIQQLLGDSYAAFEKILTDKDMRTKTWNMLMNDPDKRGPDFALLFKEDTAKFNEILTEIDKAKSSQDGVRIVKLMLQGKSVSEKPKPQKPKEGSGFDVSPYITGLGSLLQDAGAPLTMVGKLLNAKNEEEFKKIYQENMNKAPTEPMLKLYNTYLTNKPKQEPTTIPKKDTTPKPLFPETPMTTPRTVQQLGEALSKVK